MVAAWQRFTRGEFELVTVEGNHLFPLQPGAKAAWLGRIARALGALPVLNA